jgi:hypothetical protein
MEKKQRYRVFWFNFTNNSEDNKDFIKTLDYQYIMFYESEDTKIISGYVRFKNQRLQKSVETKTFLKKATVTPENRSEKKIKALYSQKYKIYEYGTPTNQGARNDIVKIPKSLDTQIAKTDEINKLIHSVQDYNTCKSEQIKDVCVTLTQNITNNNNETCKDVHKLICFVKGIEFEIQELLYNTKFDRVDAVKKIFHSAYDKLNSEMPNVHCTNIARETNAIY